MSLPLDLIDANRDRVWYSLAQTEYFNHYGLMQTDRHKMQFPVKDFLRTLRFRRLGWGFKMRGGNNKNI